MTITRALYVEIEESSPMTYDVRILDEEVEVIVGSKRGFSSSLHLVLDRPETCTNLARVLTEAAERFDRELSARYHASGERDLDVQLDTERGVNLSGA